jgi:hypothetical protein
MKIIDKLIQQCTTEWAGGGPHSFDKETFAELIVRECADIAKHDVMNISTYADAKFVEEQITKYFGVEE